MKKYFLCIIIALSQFAFSQNEDEKYERIFPEINSLVIDSEDIISKEEEIKLEKLLHQIHTKTGHKIFVIIRNLIEPWEDPDLYSLALAKHINDDLKLNSSILIYVNNGLRKIRIQNIDEITEKLTDSETKEIIDSIIIPEFKNGRYYNGLYKGIEKISTELQ